MWEALQMDFLTNKINCEKLFDFDQEKTEERVKTNGIKIQKNRSHQKLEKQAQ